MTKTPSGSSGVPSSSADEHGPVRAERISPSDYSEKFLRDLQVRKQVLAVGQDWNGDSSGLPRGVNWVIYPNGDLERVGFD